MGKRKDINKEDKKIVPKIPKSKGICLIDIEDLLKSSNKNKQDNIIQGNIKSLLMKNSELYIPYVAYANAYQYDIVYISYTYDKILYYDDMIKTKSRSWNSNHIVQFPLISSIMNLCLSYDTTNILILSTHIELNYPNLIMLLKSNGFKVYAPIEGLSLNADKMTDYLYLMTKLFPKQPKG